jgi:hypothetical protein
MSGATGALSAGATELNPSNESTGVVPQIIVEETNQQEDAVESTTSLVSSSPPPPPPTSQQLAPSMSSLLCKN